MEFDPLPLPSDLGTSKGVQRRLRQSFPTVRVAYTCPEIVAEAAVRKYPFWQEIEPPAPTDGGGREEGERSITLPELVYCVGIAILEQGEALVAADHALDRARRQYRTLCARRDDVKRRLYRERVDFRKTMGGQLGRKRARQCPILQGETPRDPRELVREAKYDVHWAAKPDESFARSVLDLEIEWSKWAAPMAPLARELDAANDALDDDLPRVHLAQERRTHAMKKFDSEYGRGARFLERMLESLGLPTLAAMVRPHVKGVGTVGRPAKEPKVDAHPDLVQRALESGLLPAETVAAARASLASVEDAAPAAGKRAPWPTRAIRWWRRRLRAA